MEQAIQSLEVRSEAGSIGGFSCVPKTSTIRDFLKRHCLAHDVPIFFHYLCMTYREIIIIDRFQLNVTAAAQHSTLMRDFIVEIEPIAADLVIALVVEKDNQQQSDFFRRILDEQNFMRWWNTREGYLMKLDLRTGVG